MSDVFLQKRGALVRGGSMKQDESLIMTFNGSTIALSLLNEDESGQRYTQMLLSGDNYDIFIQAIKEHTRDA